MENSLTLSGEQVLLLGQLMEIDPWLGVAIQISQADQKLLSTGLLKACNTLETEGLIVRQSNGKIGMAEWLFAVLSAIKEADAILSINANENHESSISVTIFKKMDHFVLQSWSKHDGVKLTPYVKIDDLKNELQKETNSLLNLHDIESYTVEIYDKELNCLHNATENANFSMSTGPEIANVQAEMAVQTLNDSIEDFLSHPFA